MLFIEIIGGGVTVLAGLFGLIKYMVGQNTKREKFILDHHKSQQTEMMEFYEKKNGHLERVATRFAESTDKMSGSMGKLTTQIQILNSHNKST